MAEDRLRQDQLVIDEDTDNLIHQQGHVEHPRYELTDEAGKGGQHVSVELDVALDDSEEREHEQKGDGDESVCLQEEEARAHGLVDKLERDVGL